MNDCLHTNVFVRFSPETVACACFHLSARILKVPLPTSPAWYLVFGIETEAITEVCKSILQLYARKPQPQEELEENVEVARKALDDAKLKAKSQLNAQGTDTPNPTSLDSIIIDSRTNSPIKYSSDVSMGTSSKSLEVLSVINRLKQQQQQKQESAKTSPADVKLKSTINVSGSNPGSAINSASSTPIKLEKSPRTLVLPPTKRSRSPSPRDYRRNSRERKDSYSSGDDNSKNSQEHSSRYRYKNGHSTTNNYEDDYKESRYRESDSYRRRSRSPPRSYVSSTVSVGNDFNSSSTTTTSKYRRIEAPSRSPSIDSSSDRRGHSRHKSSRSSSNSYRDRPEARYDDRYSSRHEHRSRGHDYDSRDRRGGEYRGDRYADDGYGRSGSRSPSGYRHRDDYHKSSRNRSKY